MKKFIVFVLSLVMILSLAACGTTVEKPAETPAETPTETPAETPGETPAAPSKYADSDGNFTADGKFKIALICPAMYDAWQYLYNETVVQFFEEKGNPDIEIVQLDAQADPQKCIEFFEQIMMEGDYGMVLTPALANFSDYFDRLIEAGVAVLNINVALDEIVEAGKVSVYRCSDYNCGAQITQHVIDNVAPGSKGVILEGQAGQISVMQRYQGITETLEGTDLEILAVRNADWSNDSAYTVVTDWLTTYGDFDFIISENDNMALGAVEAIMAAGKNPEDFVIVGIDGLYLGASAVLKGTMSATAQQDASLYAESIYNAAIGIMDGIRSYKDVDYEDYSPVIITKDNAQALVDMYVEMGLDQ